MLAVVTILLVAQQPPTEVCVVLSRRASVPPPRALKLLEQLYGVLEAAGVQVLPRAATDQRLSQLGYRDATFCGGKRACLAELARQLPATTVVGLSVVEVARDIVVNVEAVGPDGARLAQADASGASARLDPAAAFEAFARQLASSLAPRQPQPEEPPLDRKDVTAAAPSPVPPAAAPPAAAPPAAAPPPEAVTTSQPGRRWPAVLAGVAAGFALVTGAVLAGHALHLDATVNRTTEIDGRQRSAFAYGQATQLEGRANAELWAAIGSAALGLALAVTCAILAMGGSP